MLSTLDLMKLKVRARDGDIGAVHDLRFDETDWTVRDLEIDTGGWIFGQRVIIDPDAVLEAEAPGFLDLDLTRDEVKALPDTPARPEAAAQSPEDILTWNKSEAMVQVPEALLIGGASVPVPPMPAISEEAHLHGLREVTGYSVMCGEESVGKLAGFLIDTVAWDLPLALVQLDNGEGPVLLPSRLINAITWPERSIQTSLDAAMLRDAPAYDERVQDDRVFMPVVTDYFVSKSPAA